MDSALKHFSLLCLLFLAGCATMVPAAPLPPWVAVVETGEGRRCTGFVVNPTTVVGAAHCNHPDLLVKARGKEVPVKVVYSDDIDDIAVLSLARPLRLSGYAAFASPHPLRPAFVFGSCPEYTLETPRRIFAATQQNDLLVWWVDDGVVCGGDSGGPVVQDGEVIGIVLLATSNFVWLAPSSTILETLEACNVC